jgi:hypothetical protein
MYLNLLHNFVIKKTRVAEPENLKTVPVPVPTFYLTTVPALVPVPVESQAAVGEMMSATIAESMCSV